MRQKFARRSILGYGLGGAGAALLGLTSRSQAATTTFKATLNAATEVPPNQSPATGTATVTLDSATNAITWSGTFSGLTGPATAAHIHGPAPAGKNAGVILWISTKGSPFNSPFEGKGQLTAEQAADLMAGNYYVNIHTAANPGGEIRGQLVKS
ncbi:MAG: CHRD domain-containing protein [Xanthobacteraceae bacterium]